MRSAIRTIVRRSLPIDATRKASQHSLIGGTGRSRLSRAVRVRIGDTERNNLTKAAKKQRSTLTSTNSRYRTCFVSTGSLRNCNRARTITLANCSWVVGVLRPHAGGGCGRLSQATESDGPVLTQHRRLGLTSESRYVIRHPDAKLCFISAPWRIACGPDGIKTVCLHRPAVSCCPHALSNMFVWAVITLWIKIKSPPGTLCQACASWPYFPTGALASPKTLFTPCRLPGRSPCPLSQLRYQRSERPWAVPAGRRGFSHLRDDQASRACTSVTQAAPRREAVAGRRTGAAAGAAAATASEVLALCHRGACIGNIAASGLRWLLSTSRTYLPC